jgi:hypothetical protein
MTANQFRELALSLPDVVESAHMKHPDFRLNGKIFATLGYPDEQWGTVKLSPAEQGEFIREWPDAFVPANGAWGRQGSTQLKLKSANKTCVRKALTAAWTSLAAKSKKPKTARYALKRNAPPYLKE